MRITPRSTLGLAWLALALMASIGHAAPVEKLIVDFKSKERALNWQIVNDDVMGGVSTSRFAVTNGVGQFRGNLSLENNGGFASVRADGAISDLTGNDAMVVRVKGDGRNYQLRVRTATGGRADYQTEFQTVKGQWQEHRLPFAGFVPTWRGRLLTGVPPIDPARVQSIGFFLADNQPGAFELEIQWVKATGQNPKTP